MGLDAQPATTEQALEALGLRWRSGKYLALAGGHSFGLHLDAGRIIFATSTQRSLRLGHLLLQIGAVRPSFLQHVLGGARVLSGAAALGRVLVREGAVSRSDLAFGIEEQCVQVLARMIELPSATFLHISNDPLPAEIEVVPMETDRLFDLAEVISDQRAAIHAMQVLLPVPAEELVVNQVALSKQLLSHDEALVSASIQIGMNTLVSLCSTLSLEPLTIKRVVIGLLERGCIVRLSAPM